MGNDEPRPVPLFDRRFFDGEHAISRIGGGGLGGKAAGLRRIHEHILPRIDLSDLPGFAVDVPRMVVLATDVFELFMARNELWSIATSDASDDRVSHAFRRAELPAEIVGDLRRLIAGVHTPLAIRSSSLLEDALDHPFAGVYATKMIPNNELEEDRRFRRLVDAIRFVYASTFFSAATAYRRSIAGDDRAERMAVIIQEVVGQRTGSRFYPTVSGVGRSFNFYPTGHGRPQDGVVSLALGLGKTIVDGGLSWSYCPRYPKAPPPFNSLKDLLQNTQTRFWAVYMGEPPVPDPMRETESLVAPELSQAEADGTLALVASSYDAASDRLDPGLARSGPRAVTFAPLLGSRFIPFDRAVERMLTAARDELGSDVEIELAATFDPDDILPARIGFLQVRPMRVSHGSVVVEAAALTGSNIVIASQHVLGNGRRDDITDVVYLDEEQFDRALTPQIAVALERVNRALVAQGRPYLLIGFGRWGTSDPWLGVPVSWGQIGGARVIVEATLPEVNADLSQGSHFFHNLLGFEILYLSVPFDGPGYIDWQWLRQQEVITHDGLVRHVRATRPLEIAVDGVNRRGMVRCVP